MVETRDTLGLWVRVRVRVRVSPNPTLTLTLTQRLTSFRAFLGLLTRGPYAMQCSTTTTPPQATWTTSIAQFKPAQPECSVLPAGGNAEGMGNADDLTQLTWQHLLGPILSLVFFAGIAIVLKLILKWCASKLRQHLPPGRPSKEKGVSKVSRG